MTKFNFTKYKFINCILAVINYPIILFFFFSFPSFSQPYQIVTKTVEKTLVYPTGGLINVNSDKSQVFVTGWDKSDVSIRIVAEAKHEDKEKAEKALTFFSYQINPLPNQIDIITNIEEGYKKAKLNCRIEIFAPLKSNIKIDNHFGDTEIKNFTDKILVINHFGDIKLENVRGKITLESKFGKIKCNQLKGEMNVNGKFGDITINDLEGKVIIDSKFGDITLKNLFNMHGVDIIASKGDVEIINSDANKFNYDLETSFGDIILPDAIDVKTYRKSGFQNKIVNKINPDNTEIKVLSSFGDITIK